MEMKFKILDDKFVIEKDDVLITLTFDEIRKLNSSIGRIGHDKDVKKAMKDARKAVLYTVEDLKALWDKEYDVRWDWNSKM